MHSTTKLQTNFKHQAPNGETGLSLGFELALFGQEIYPGDPCPNPPPTRPSPKRNLRAASEAKRKVPSTNIQHPEKHQTSSSKLAPRFLGAFCLDLGPSLDVGCWCLEFPSSWCLEFP